MGSKMIGRPHDSEDQPHRNEETSLVDVYDFDVVFGYHGDLADDHVSSRKSETDHVVRRGVLVESGSERLGTDRPGLDRSVGMEHRPAGRVESDVRGLSRPVDRDVVLPGDDHGSAEAVAAELDRDSLASIDQLLGLVGQTETAATVNFGEPLVLGGLLVPFPPGTLAELRGEIGVGLTSVIHGFSRSRHPTWAAG